MVTHTSIGQVIITHRHLASFDVNGVGGEVAAGILLKNGKPDVYILMFQINADWMFFHDGEENNPASLSGWEPDAIEEALQNLPDHLREDDAEVDEQFEWFYDWAERARETLDAEDDGDSD